MLKEMNRRDFLKVSAVTGASILATDLLYTEAPTVYGAVKIPEAERMTITIIEDNYCDSLRPDSKIAKRYGGDLYAEHGLACHIETVVDGRSHSMLFDFGRTFPVVSTNIDALKIDFEKLEVLALSHGHVDHYGGLLQILESHREKISRKIPLYVGEDALVESRGSKVVHRPPTKEEIEGLGFVKVVEIKDPTPIVPGVYLTGRIERVMDYEKLDRPESFIGEQSVVLNAKGKGLVVLSGCAHVGIVNTVKHAQEITGVQKVHAIMGGFHLIGAKEERIHRTVADIKGMGPDYIVPMHCTGFEAVMAFAKEMPNQFILNTVGTRYIFSSQTV